MTDLDVRPATPPAHRTLPPPAAATSVDRRARPHGGRSARSSEGPAARSTASGPVAVAAATVGLVLVTWARHGGPALLAAGGSDTWTSLARLTGLLASVAGLLGLALVARPRRLERGHGLDRLFVWHKWLGGTMAVLVAAHVVTSLAAWAGGSGWWRALADLTGTEPYLAGATVGTLLLVVVAMTSVRPVRRRMSYETWYLLHLTAYAALALAFAHQLVLGGDLADDAVTRWAWIAAHVGVLAALVVGRWGRLLGAYLRPLRVRSVRPVAPGTVELHLTGGSRRVRRARAGQFVILRPLVARLWWQGHPYSLAAAPTGDGLTLTVKDRGDASGALCRLRPGARVAVEGPYGALTPRALDPDRPVLFVVGGVGVAPVRALLQDLDRRPPGAAAADPVLCYRARHRDDLVHVDELRDLVHRHGGRVLTLVGRRGELDVDRPFSGGTLLAAVPDLARRQAVVCGPEELCAAARRGLCDAGVPTDRIHYDRSWW